MALLNYKHKKKEQSRRLEKSFSSFSSAPSIDEEVVIKTEEIKHDFDEILASNLLTNTLNSLQKGVNSVFERELVNDISIFEDFIKSHYPDLKSYLGKDPVTGFETVSLRALVDARAYLINEFGETAGDLLDPEYDVNASNINYSEFTIKNNGKIYQSNNIVFDPTAPCKAKVSEIDFKKMTVSIEPGLIVPFAYLLDLTKNISNDVSDSFASSNPNGNLLDVPSYGSTLDPLNNEFYNSLITKNPNITDKDIEKITFGADLDVDTLMTAVGVNDYTDKLKNFVLSPELNKNVSSVEGITVCNIKEINFIYLLMLIIIGGGEEGVRPLGSKNNQIINSNISGCKSLSVNTYHPMAWTSSKKQGLKRSILQIVTPIVNIYKGFNVKAIKVPILGTVFRGICILGNLELGVFRFQADISEKIRNAFKCEIKYSAPALTSNGYGLSLKTETRTLFTKNNPVKSFISSMNGETDVGIVKEGTVIDAIVEVMANKQYPMNYTESSGELYDAPEAEANPEPIVDADALIEKIPYFYATYDKAKATLTFTMYYPPILYDINSFIDTNIQKIIDLDVVTTRANNNNSKSTKNRIKSRSRLAKKEPVEEVDPDEIKEKIITLQVVEKTAGFSINKKISVAKDKFIRSKAKRGSKLLSKELAKLNGSSGIFAESSIKEFVEIDLEENYFFFNEMIYLITTK